MTKLLFIPTLLLSSMVQAGSISGDEFVNCFEKAYNERAAEVIQETRKECKDLSQEDKDKLSSFYSAIQNGQLVYASPKEMGQYSVRYHYEALMYEFGCYPSPSNIGSAWIKGFGSAIGVYKRTNFDFVEEVFTIMLGQEMWTHNGSDLFSEHNFDYCRE